MNTQDEQIKKSYNIPELTNHGSITQLTRSATMNATTGDGAAHGNTGT